MSSSGLCRNQSYTQTKHSYIFVKKWKKSEKQSQLNYHIITTTINYVEINPTKEAEDLYN